MSRLVHLSDLHFGAIDPALPEALLMRVQALAPDVVVISGDLTQRARAGQYRAAQRFIRALDCPVLAVPGNHDIPLYNVFARFLTPFAGFRRHISTDLAPVWQDERLLIAGINTANPWAWKQGRITGQQLDALERIFAGAGGRTCMVAMHHPLEHLPGETQWLMQGSEAALARLPQMGARIVLSGHIHISHAGPFTAAPGLLFVQAGTGLSWRRRSEANAFNLLDFTDDGVVISTLIADTEGQFGAPEERHRMAWAL